MLRLMATAAALDSWKPRARHLGQAVLPESLVLLAPLLLLADCSGKVVGAVVEALLVQAVQAVQVVVVQVAAVAVLAAAHTQQVLAGLVGVVGLWYWSFDHAAICSC